MFFSYFFVWEKERNAVFLEVNFEVREIFYGFCENKRGVGMRRDTATKHTSVGAQRMETFFKKN